MNLIKNQIKKLSKDPEFRCSRQEIIDFIKKHITCRDKFVLLENLFSVEFVFYDNFHDFEKEEIALIKELLPLGIRHEVLYKKELVPYLENKINELFEKNRDLVFKLRNSEVELVKAKKRWWRFW